MPEDSTQNPTLNPSPLSPSQVNLNHSLSPALYPNLQLSPPVVAAAVDLSVVDGPHPSPHLVQALRRLRRQWLFLTSRCQ
jgi:hypothetical protein